MQLRITFDGLRDIVSMISRGNRHYPSFNGLRSAIALQFQKSVQTEYKLTRPAYTSKLLGALLKEEVTISTFDGPTVFVNPKVWEELIKVSKIK